KNGPPGSPRAHNRLGPGGCTKGAPPSGECCGSELRLPFFFYETTSANPPFYKDSFTVRAHPAAPARAYLDPMNAILVKLFATALALSQVTTQPGTVKIQFDAERDQEQVVKILRAGCAHIRKAFDIEDVNVDELIA